MRWRTCDRSCVSSLAAARFAPTFTTSSTHLVYTARNGSLVLLHGRQFRRFVALSPDAIRELDLYLHARRRLPHTASSPLLVHRVGGLRAYSGPGFGRRLHDLFMRADIRTTGGCIPARNHQSLAWPRER